MRILRTLALCSLTTAVLLLGLAAKWQGQAATLQVVADQ